MRAFNFKAPEWLAEELVKRAESTGLTVSEIIRRALFMYLYLDSFDHAVCWQKAMDSFKARIEGRKVEPRLLKFRD